MKLKNLLYGTAAILVSTGAANVALAADLPVAAEPVEYVRICDAYGNGFYYIPGSDTCLKINGRVRARFFARDEDDSDKNYDHYRSYARGYIFMDARNETDLGLLRSFVEIYATTGSASSGISQSGYDLKYDTGFTLGEAFISLSNDMGQLTVGKTASFFDFFGGYTLTGNGGFDQTTDANLLAYTFNVGNGVSVTLSAEDAYADGKKGSEGTAEGIGGSGGNILFASLNHGGLPVHSTDPDIPDNTTYAFGTIYGGQDIPDLVANLRVDQGWGSAQIMGALRQLTVKKENCLVVDVYEGAEDDINLCNEFDVSYVDDDDWGWAVGAGLELNVPGMPISFAIQGGYSEGMLSTVMKAPDVAADAIAVGPSFPDDVGHLVLTEGWQIGAGVDIAASSTVSFQIDGAYGDVDHYGSLHDYDYWGLAGVVAWKPVTGLLIAGEIQYSEVNADLSSGFCSDDPDTRCSEVDDTDSWQFTLSFQRDF